MVNKFLFLTSQIEKYRDIREFNGILFLMQNLTSSEFLKTMFLYNKLNSLII